MQWTVIQNHNGLQCWWTGSLAALARHRSNYDELGPDLHSLQILWWEFPLEHWDALHEGSQMNFLSPSKSGIHPNMLMNEEQLRIVGQFIDELLDIGVLGYPPTDQQIKQDNGPSVLCTQTWSAWPMEGHCQYVGWQTK